MRSANKALALLLPILAGAADAPAPVIAFTVPPEHRLIEGIASNGETIWVSSVLDRSIVAQRHGRQRDIPLTGIPEYPLGMAWDGWRGWLWIAGDCPALPGTARCDQGALIAIDRKGRVQERASAPAPFHPGDVSVANGAVYVSDSANGAVYAWTGRDLPLRPVIVPGVGHSAQGSVRIGNRLFVADYRYGIAAVDLTTGQRTLLPQSDGKPLNGVDGLTRAGSWLIGVRNGGPVPTILAFRAGYAAVTDVRVLARGAPLTDPTQLVVSGNRLLIVADAGWEAAVEGTVRSEAAKIMALPLPR